MKLVASILVAVFLLSGCNTNMNQVNSDYESESSLTQSINESTLSDNSTIPSSNKDESPTAVSKESAAPSSSGVESPSEANENSTASGIEAVESSVEQESFDFVYGKYVCAGDKFSEDHFVRFPEDIPYITFRKNGSCEVSVNYMEGLCVITGAFSVEGNQIFVELNFNGTMYEGTGTEYMDDKYVYSNVGSGQIIIDRDCYFVIAGDKFQLEVS